MRTVLSAILAGTVLLTGASCAPERIDYGPFYHRADEPDRLYLDGALARDSASAFASALRQWPDVSTLVLNGVGGTALESLVIAEFVRAREMDTIVPSGSTCDGTCFFVFAAGAGRMADGAMAIRDAPDSVSTQYVDDDSLRIIATESLQRSGASEDLLALFSYLGVHHEHYFDAAEKATTRLDRSHTEGLAAISHPQDLSAPQRPLFFSAVGDFAPARLSFTDAATREVNQRLDGAARWYVSTDLARPAIQARLATVGTVYDATVTLFRNPDAGDPIFGDTILIELGAEGPEDLWSGLESVGEFLTFDDDGGAGLYYIAEADVSTDNDGRHVIELKVPRIYAEQTYARYSSYDRFSIYLQFDDGREAVFLFFLDDQGRAAFDEVIESWRER